MDYGRCTVCDEEIHEGAAVTITGITIISGGGAQSSSEVHYAHATCHQWPKSQASMDHEWRGQMGAETTAPLGEPQPNHVRDAVEANR